MFVMRELVSNAEVWVNIFIVRNGFIHHDPLSIKSLLLYQLSYAGNLVKSYQSRIDEMHQKHKRHSCQLLTKNSAKKKRGCPR